MILRAKDGIRGILLDADTGQKIPLPVWADLDTGEYERFATLDGKTVIHDGQGSLIRHRGKVRKLQFVPSASVIKPKPLTPEQEAKEIRAIAPDYVSNYQELDLTPGIQCDEPKCHALAQWEVAHEQEIDAGINHNGNPCERAVTIQVNRWCSQHWQPGTFRSIRGVEDEVETNVRPT